MLTANRNKPETGNTDTMAFIAPLYTLFCSALIAALIYLPHAALADIVMERYDPVDTPPLYRWCTQLYFNQGHEIVVDLKNSRFLYRAEGAKDFTAGSLPLLRPHSLVFNPVDQLYYMADTDNNRIITFDSLTSSQANSTASVIAGIELERPHDIVHDQDNNWLYAINPLSAVIFRFKGIGQQESYLDLSKHLGYSRSLTFSNGKLYVIGSSRGKVVEITDFDSGTFNVYQSPGKTRVAPEGTWQQTGLVLNDIEYFKGYWYASSYFYPEGSFPGLDYNENKLIRFRTWEQFEKGEWQDLSYAVPDALVPYYLTAHREHLYIPLYNHRVPGEGDCIYRISER